MKSLVPLFVVWAAVTACAPDGLELPPVVWEGENVRVRMEDESIQVCGGTFEGLDRHAALAREAMLLDWNGDLVEYSLGHIDFLEDACIGTTLGCANSDTGHVFTRRPFHLHEVVHSVRFLDPNRTLHSSPIEEGLATLFGAGVGSEGTTSLEALKTLQLEQVGGDTDYYRSGQLMAMLIATYGIETFRAFDLAASRDDENAAFASVFGVTKTEFAAIAEETPQCSSSQWWQPLLECAGEPELPDPDTGQVTFTGDLRCDSSDVYGPAQGDNMWTSRHFQIDDMVPPFYYEMDFPEDTTLEVVGCDGGCPERFVYRGGRWDVGSVANGIPGLEPGEYFMRLSRPVSDEPGPFRIVF